VRSAQLLERLRAIAQNYPTLELEEITNDSPWPPGGDSMTAVEVMLELEKELGVELPADAIDRIGTVGDAIRYFERRTRT
jgi:acyl carrier protein